MAKILIPASNPEDWKVFLADSEKHWKRGYSARSLAYCWQDADGVPPEVQVVLNQVPVLNQLKTIFAVPEHQVPLPGGSTKSQNDVWVLGETNSGLVSIAVEGKVSEPFGPTIGEWYTEHSPGKEKRLRFLCRELCVSFPPPNYIRYQLLHRTASAIIEAKRFRANVAVMVVHTFSSTNEWFEDYQSFLSLYGLNGEVNQTVSTMLETDVNLCFAWVHGDSKWLDA